MKFTTFLVIMLIANFFFSVGLILNFPLVAKVLGYLLIVLFIVFIAIIVVYNT